MHGRLVFISALGSTLAVALATGACGSGSDEPGGSAGAVASTGAGAVTGSIAGPSGGSGSSGSAGTTGSSGATGTTGATGATGATGVAGTTSGAAGATGSIATTGSAAGSPVPDAGASGQPCHAFASGVNVAWVDFARDIPFSGNPTSPLPAFQTLFANTFNAGGRVVRWWLHTNGTVTPGYDGQGMAQALPAQDIADIKSVLDAAHAAGVGVNLSLWSFDMLQGPGSGEDIPTNVLTDNQLLLTTDANRNAYITRVLVPLATALKGYPGLYSWEIFNEPEGMTPAGWTGNSTNMGLTVSEAVIQKCVNLFASAIHTADPNALVTNGAVTLQYAADYSDANLVAAGGAANGTLDFYEAHYYAGNGSKVSPFTHTAASWNLPDTKPIVIGEFYALATDGVAADDTYTTLYSQGYGGAWAWQYESNDPKKLQQRRPEHEVAGHADPDGESLRGACRGRRLPLLGHSPAEGCSCATGAKRSFEARVAFAVRFEKRRFTFCETSSKSE